MNKVKKHSIIIGIVGLMFILTGVTYSFFNYTKTGVANNISVGNIVFNTSQDGNINLTNVFPITSDELDDDVGNHDSVTINITGSTTYADGIEYLVTFSDVHNSLNNKEIPIVFSVESSNLGTSREDYYHERGRSTSVYQLTENVLVEEGEHVAVGYITTGATGINGSITVTAYVDGDKIAITDTYVSGKDYEYNSNMTQEEINVCAIHLMTVHNYALDNYFPWEPENTTQSTAFCRGETSGYGKVFQDAIDDEIFIQEQLNYLEEHDIIIDRNRNLASITIDKQCSAIKNMNFYPWIGDSYQSGTSIYGVNNEVCDAFQ